MPTLQSMLAQDLSMSTWAFAKLRYGGGKEATGGDGSRSAYRSACEKLLTGLAERSSMQLLEFTPQVGRY